MSRKKVDPAKMQTFAERAEFLYDFAHGSAGRIIFEHGLTLAPMLIALAGDGELALLPPRAVGLSKGQTAHLLGVLAESPRVAAAMFVCETWVKKGPLSPEDEASVERGEKTLGDLGGSDAVMVVIRGKGEQEQLWATCAIDRVAKRLERPPLEPAHSERSIAHGRFFKQGTKH